MNFKKKFCDVRDMVFSSTLLSLFAVFFVIAISLVAGLLMFFYMADTNRPEANIGNRVYVPTYKEGYADNEDYYECYYPGGRPIALTDLGVEVMDYGYSFSYGLTLPLSEQSTFIDSMADDIENPTQVFTLSYIIFESKHKFMIDRKEKSLQKRYGGEIAETELDYGVQCAYWIGDHLLLRCDDNSLFFFNSETTKELIDSEACAAFVREQVEKGTLLYSRKE